MLLGECLPFLVVILWQAKEVLAFEHKSSEFLQVVEDVMFFEISMHERQFLHEMESRDDNGGSIALNKDDLALVAKREVARTQMAVSRVNLPLVASDRR